MAADPTYQTKNYEQQGGANWVIGSGGTFTVESGGWADSPEIANANATGGAPVLHRIDIAAGALGTTSVTLTYKTRVIDAWLVLEGAGVSTTTLQVKNGTNAITDAMAASGSDNAIVHAATIDDAYHEIAAGGTLAVVSATGATQPAAVVYILGVRVA